MRYLLPAALLLSFVGCAESGLNERSDEGSLDTGFGNSESPDDNDGGFGQPEQEDDFLALMPATTDVYVFVANPSRGTITRVHVQTLAVDTTEVGAEPAVVITTPDYGTAVVFNEGDDTVSIVDAHTLDQRVVPVRDNFNRMVLSPDGQWAALWHDVRAEDPADPAPSGLVSYNEVSFVHIPTGVHHPMAVGFKPKEVQFTPDGLTSVVVSDEYLAVIDLTAEVLLPDLVQVAESLLDPPPAEEVVVAPSGAYAFVRQFGADALAVVDLTNREVSRIPVGLNPTDLDLSPDGTRAVVVSRGSEELYVFDTADPVNIAPEVLALPTGEGFGSVLFDPVGQQAVLYTTASPIPRYASWDLGSDTITLRSLVKPVANMAISPTGESMLVFHTLQDAPDADVTSPFYAHWALTLIDLTDHRSNPLRLPGEPIGYANSLGGERGYFIMEGQPYLEVLRYDSLLYDEIALRSAPRFVGVLPDLDVSDGDVPPAWVSQEHELGRITFYDADDGTAETITGFELNSQIED
ncbi:MAG: hypothetical protein EP330_16200 [Deltaproteobacteria bacterium]|nr:MAG: hypothetical protein EP330_16200 [Deltaproteobacteria bacterium]